MYYLEHVFTPMEQSETDIRVNPFNTNDYTGRIFYVKGTFYTLRLYVFTVILSMSVQPYGCKANKILSYIRHTGSYVYNGISLQPRLDMAPV